MNFLNAIDFDQYQHPPASATLQKSSFSVLSKSKLVRDLKDILGGLNIETEGYNPSISTINKVFQALDRLSEDKSVLQEHYKLISSVMRR